MTNAILNPQVSVIPATKRHIKNGDQFRSQIIMRVAAYCRVSTEEESQENSYAIQKKHYTSMILSRPGWELAGIYADEGKSGTTRKGRIQFNRLLNDCRAGKVDYVITKSISRFARNTADALDCVHELQNLRPPVGIYFEREGIDTLNQNSEMFLTIYCSMAQEESHSISENIKWSLQKKFRAGTPQINLRRMLGYDMEPDGTWSINEPEAEIIRYMYQRYLEGASANAIALELNQSGRSTVNRKPWRSDSVLYILQNEKYVGDLIMQKTYTESFLTHKSVKNTGEYPQYFKSNHHPPIVTRETWDKTQALIACRQQSRLENQADDQKSSPHHKETPRKGGSAAHPFTGITCAYCGKKMRRMTYNSTIRGYQDERSHAGKPIPPEEANYVDTYTFSYGVWKCPGSAGKNGIIRNGCPALSLTEVSMEQSFMELLYQIHFDLQSNRENSKLNHAFQKLIETLMHKEIQAETQNNQTSEQQNNQTSEQQNNQTNEQQNNQTNEQQNNQNNELQNEPQSNCIDRKRKLLEMEIADLEETYLKYLEQARNEINFIGFHPSELKLEPETTYYSNLAGNLRKQIEEKKKEYQKLEGNQAAIQQIKQNFESFCNDIQKLTTKTSTGQPLNIRLSQHSSEPLDYLFFNEYLFRHYILHTEAEGDKIHYTTTFGLKFTSTENSRSIHSYLGYRITRSDQTTQIITETYQIARGKIQHHWRKR